ncbi:MAG: DctP family TRAP transporter solute-binding subunit [Hyphomicrobiaceae bacterium]
MHRIMFSTLMICALLAGVSQANAKCDPGEMIIKFGHVAVAKDHPKGEVATLLAQRINEQMNGTACMQVFPNSQLYADKNVLEAMIFGDIHVAAPSLLKLGKYTKKLQVFDLPFIFASIGSVEKFQSSETGQELLQSIRENGFVGLGYLHNGMKHFSANKPLLVPDDAVELKFRVQTSKLNAAMIEALDARPQKLALKEVYRALQTGVVNGQDNSFSNIFTKKFFEVQDGITETNHLVLDDMMIVSVDWYEGLPVDVRMQFKNIVDEVVGERNTISVQINNDFKNKIIKAGGEIRTLTADQRRLWVERMEPVWGKYEEEIGADIIEAARNSNF